MIEPVKYDVEGTRDLQILEWPSGALEFRRAEVGSTETLKRFHCFVVSGAERVEFLEKLDEIRKING